MASHGDITNITMIHQKITKHPHVQGKGPTTGGQEEDVDETPREAPFRRRRLPGIPNSSSCWFS